MPRIHPTAVVEEGALLEEGVDVGALAYIESGARIGKGCKIRAHANITRWATLGEGCDVFPGAYVGGDPQDLAFKPDTSSYVVVGNHTIIREGCSIHRGTAPDSVTRVGDHCFLMGNTHIAHNCQLGNHIIAVNGALFAGYVEVGDRAFISGNVTIHQFVRVGTLCMLSGLSALTMDLPPYCILSNTDTNNVTGLNVVGMRRAGFSPEERLEIKRVYREFYTSQLLMSDAIVALQQMTWSPKAQAFVDFLAGSKRGIAKPR